MSLILPNGLPLLVTGEDGLRHEYDPAYARAYYLRTRKLKGRAKATAAAKAPAKANQKVYRQKLDAFLSKLPMAVEGADLKTTEAFVDKMRKMSDTEMRAEAARIKKEKGDMDGAQVATIEALLKNRERTRKRRAAKKPAAKKPAAKKPAAKSAPAAKPKPSTTKPELKPAAAGVMNRRALISLGKAQLGG